ncbi:ATP-grasp fold amidoligase family protein [Parabacteroides johnsonii]|uniref:ATP-grasp fold amidoligase family protein n=1 Tax=Parabacteroides johnsonii TaxID=387661 RepID=UPI003AB7825C
MNIRYKLKRVFYYLANKPRVLLLLLWNWFVPIVSDKFFLKVRFRLTMGYWMDFDNPKTFNEKLQWFKVNDIHPEYSLLVDKVAAKDYVVGKIGDKYIIPTLGVWDNIEDIDWKSLPNQFVIKSTADSGGVVVCKDKSKLDIDAAKQKLKVLGGRDYTKINKEYPYRNVPHRYIAEKYMEDESGFELKDYKIFCFDGKAEFLFVATGRQQNDCRFDFFDKEFNHIPVLNGHANADVMPQKPKNFEEMLEVAAKLSVGFPQIRVDLYNINGEIYFGELTFFHWSGMVPFEPMEYDYKFGEYIKLPRK